MTSIKISNGRFYCGFCSENGHAKITECDVIYSGDKGAVSSTITCKYCGRNIPQSNQIK